MKRLKSFSNCEFECGNLFIKRTNTLSSSIALEKSIKRQENFKETDYIHVPKVHSCVWIDQETLKVEMEFIEEDDITDKIDNLLSWIENNFDGCHLNLSDDYFVNKIDSIMTSVDKDDVNHTEFQKILREFRQKILSCKSKIKSGYSHGDLTLCNVLFSDNLLYLIDFSYNPVKSPIYDLVKLKQDTEHHWIRQHDDTVDVYVLNSCDKKVNEMINKHVDHESYKILQTLNFLRIIPYVKGNVKISNYLLENLSCMI